jgi:hypothetical protein
MSQTDVSTDIYETQFEYHPKVKNGFTASPSIGIQELGAYSQSCSCIYVAGI